MKWRDVASCCCLILSMFSSNVWAKTPVTAKRAATTAPFQQVFIIILENTSAAAAEKQPFLQKLQQQGAYLNNLYAVTHPSLPNYIALTAGDTYQIADDGTYNLAATHIGDLLEAKGKTWKQYTEDYPEHCFLGVNQGKYVRKHAPFLSYINVQQNQQRCQTHIVNAQQLDTDYAHNRLPDYALYIPNMDNDGHDTNIQFAGQWLEQRFGKLLTDKNFLKNRLVIITFDEDDYQHDNRIFTVLLGSQVKTGMISNTRYSSYSLLKTIEYYLQLDSLNKNDTTATIIQDVWR